jgi:hypothetical protein
MKAVTEIFLFGIYGIIETEIENYEKLKLTINPRHFFDNQELKFLAIYYITDAKISPRPKEMKTIYAPEIGKLKETVETNI